MKHNIDSILFRCTISGPSALIICPILCIGMLIAIVICSYYLAVIPLLLLCIQKRTVQSGLSLCARGNRSLAGAQNRQSPWREKHSVRSNNEAVGAADETGLAAAV